MSHMPLERIRAGLAEFGVLATILPGAQGRSARMWGSAGYPRGCQAYVSHHSVSSGLYPENDIYFILQGKGEGYVISNAYIALDGHVTLIASGPTYTEGSGGPRGIIPENGGNSVSFSTEIASWGAEDSPYPEDQQWAAVVLAAVVSQIAAEIYDWTEDPWHPWRNFAHFEWAPGRKVDPRGVSVWSPEGGMWDMDSFRSDIQELLHPTITPPEEDDMGINAIRLRLRDSSGQLYNDQLLGLTIANPEQVRQLGAQDVPLFEAELNASRSQIEDVLGFTLHPVED